MEMKDYNYLSDCLRTILEEKFPDISAKERNRIVREYDLEVLRYGYLRTDFTRTLVFLLCYTAHGDIDLIKKELIKKILLQPNFELKTEELTQEQIRTMLWICIGFSKKVGCYDDFKTLLAEWNNDMTDNPFLPFNGGFLSKNSK